MTGAAEFGEGRHFTLRPAADCGTTIVERANGGSYRRSAPVIRGPVAGWIAKALTQHVRAEVTPPPARVVRLAGATVRGPGIVTVQGDSIVREGLIDTKADESVCDMRPLGDGVTYVTQPGFAAGTPLPDAQYVLLKQRWDGNYGHWLVEGLPRLVLLADSIDLAQCKILVSFQRDPMRRVFLDSLAAFGIREDQVVVSGWAPQFIRDLIYPLPLTIQPWVKAPIAIRALEDLSRRILAGRPQSQGATKLFVLRTGNIRRELRRQDCILRMLLERGYTAVVPGQMSLDEQILAFSNARHVVGILGAECTNLAFSPRGVKFLGLAPEHMQDDFFYDLCSHKDGRYFCLHGQSETPSLGMNSPFSLDQDALLDILDEFENG